MKTKLKRYAGMTAVLVILAGSLYGFWIEPYALEVTHHRVNAPIAGRLRIAHLTDLHTRGLGRLERKLLAALEAEKPDVIVITGDSISSGAMNYDKSAEVLRQLQAPLGVWVVRGNWEVWNPLRDERGYYQSIGVKLLVDETAIIRDDVRLVGLNDWSAGSRNPEAVFEKAPRGAFTIALFHSPILFDSVSGRCDLALAGHTHGGQVRVPPIGALWTPRGCGSYLAGWYERGDSRVYVSRGIGTSVLGVRMFCRPELAMIDVGGNSDGVE